MTRKSWLIFLLAAGLLALLALALFLVKHFGASSAGTAANVRQAIGSKPSPPTVIPHFNSAIDQTILLPPSNTPLSQVVAALEVSALSGSAKAACRITQDIRRCSNANASLDLAESLARVPLLPGSKNTVAEQLLEQSQQDAEFCANVSPEVLSKAYEYQRMAASSGNKAYERWLVTTPAIDQQDFLSNLEAWSDYRRRADKYFSEALGKRDSEDFVLLLAVYAPRNVTSFRPPYRIADDQTFLALMQIAQRNRLPVPAEIAAAADSMFKTASRQEIDLVEGRAAELGQGWNFSKPPVLPHEVVGITASDAFCR